MRTVFELKVWHKDEQSCFFLLLWDNRKKQLAASLTYSKDIQKWYQRWRQRYYRFYRLSSPQALSNSGRLNPGSGDPGHDLMEAERELVQAFQRWLGEGEVRNIQQRIRDQVARVTQPASASDRELAHQPGVDIFLACDSDDMARLPWEAWPLAPEFASPGAVRMVRTAMNEMEGNRALKSSPRCRKARILAILGDDPGLPLQEDWKAVRSLKSIAKVERFTWQPEDDVTTIKRKFAAAICDSRGWDVLFFAGHSDETMATGGRMAIAPNVSLSISEIEEHLTQARENGLQLAIFNSCSGLSIANALVDLGLQVAVMREPIRNDVAQSFLKPLCQQLAQYKDIHEALLTASQHLQSAEKFAYPSAHLIPSFFSPSGTVPYRIESVGWKRQLKKFIPTRQWLPTLGEAITFGAILTLSLIPDLQNPLLDLRVLFQASYRHLTDQLYTDEIQSPPGQSVLLIAIDQESLDQESLNRSKAGMEKISPWPINREYLARLITRLSEMEARVVGIDFFTHTQQPGEEKLAKALQSAVGEQSSWFVLAVSKKDGWLVRDEVANPNWSLQGDINFYKWDVKLPNDSTCTDLCPFGYLLTLADTLDQQTDAPRTNLQSQSDFQLEVSGYIREQQRLGRDNSVSSLTQAHPPLGLRSIIDFSIPPEQAYKSISAQEVLSKPLSKHDLQQNIEQSVVIIASGGYVGAEDNFAVPPAIAYWCHSRQLVKQQKKNCPEVFSGGEVHAYMVHQLLSSHQVVQIPDWWMVCLAALFGKGVMLILLKQPANQRKKQTLILIGANVVYGLLGLQVYISVSTLIPWLLPSALFWTYVIRALKRKSVSFS